MTQAHSQKCHAPHLRDCLAILLRCHFSPLIRELRGDCTRTRKVESDPLIGLISDPVTPRPAADLRRHVEASRYVLPSRRRRSTLNIGCDFSFCERHRCRAMDRMSISPFCMQATGLHINLLEVMKNRIDIGVQIGVFELFTNVQVIVPTSVVHLSALTDC